MQENYRLYFQRQSGSIRPAAPYILVSATGSPKWNDFLFNFQAMVEISPGDGREALRVGAFVMPCDTSEASKRLDTWISTATKPSEGTIALGTVEPFSPDGQISFLTLLDSDSAYGRIAAWSVDMAERFAITSLLNDVSWLRERGGYAATQLEMLTAQDPFSLGVLRTPSAYRALHRGYRRLISVPIDPPEDARREVRIAAALKGFAEQEAGDGLMATHRIALTFREQSLFEDRVHCLIGRNGAGKTSLLRELLLHLSSSFRKKEQAEVFLDNEDVQAKVFSYKGLPYNRVLVFTADQSDQYPRAARLDSSFEYQRVNFAHSAHFGESEDERPENISAARLLMDIIRAEGIPTKEGLVSRFELLRDASSAHLNLDALHLPLTERAKGFAVVVDSLGRRWVRALDLVRLNEQRRLELSPMLDEKRQLAFLDANLEAVPLSSGQRTFFNFALNIANAIDIGTLVLIDEPETHLHPNLICDFMSLLYDMLVPFKSIAIIATHSVFVVREAPRHCVHVFKVDEKSRHVSVGSVYMKTLGASVDALSQAVFDDETVKKFHQRIAEQVAEKSTSISQVLEAYEDILSPEMLILIRSKMSDDTEN